MERKEWVRPDEDADDVSANDPQLPCGGVRIGGLLFGDLLRRVRRLAGVSQRELARWAELSPSSVARYETGALTPSLANLQRLLSAAGCTLVVVDSQRRLLEPLEVFDDVRDLAGRRFPAHLDLIVDPVYGEWWADRFGLARPPETFHRRRREIRDWERRLSQWEVRVKQFRGVERPRFP